MDLQSAPQRPVAARQCYFAYAAALLSGIVVWRALQGFAALGDPLWIGLALTCATTIVIWLFSVANGNSSIYDPYWVIAPPILALALKAMGEVGLFGTWSARQICVAACLSIWAIRYHTMYSWPGWRTGLVIEDWRYEAMRSAPLPYWLNSLIGMHLFPTLLVYFAFAPAALLFVTNPSTSSALGLWDLIGMLGALCAVVIELVADEQLRKYRSSGEYGDGGAFRRGLWKYSRHPNYFGEALFWLSMIPFAVAEGLWSQHRELIWVGPIVMAIFFRFSCWLMDVRSLERRPAYQEVIEEVNAMFPWWPKSEAP